MDQLFDEKTCCWDVLGKLVPKWKALPEEERPTTQEKWEEVLSMTMCQIDFKNIFKLVEFGMCLPGTSAPVERVFHNGQRMECGKGAHVNFSGKGATEHKNKFKAVLHRLL